MDNRTPSERFWVKVDRRGPDECWPFFGHITRGGYGGFRFDDRTRPAHRFSYQERYGNIPEGLVIDHTCHNLDPECLGGPCAHRRCVNPRHLRAVAQSVNLGSSRLTLNFASSKVTECPSGHAYDADNTAFDGADRYCRTCHRERQKADYAERNKQKRERYAELRALGMDSYQARSASKRKLAAHGAGHDFS